jgi:RNA polymerase sigma-70 factor (ECF subfamily)
MSIVLTRRIKKGYTMILNLEDIWALFENRLKSFILSRISDETAAEDILQEVFIKIHSNIDTLKDDSKIQSWIFQITRNSMNDYFRSIKKTNQHLFIPEEVEEDNSSDLMADTLKDMVKMMDELPADDCEALCLTELGGMSQKEYAKKTGISYSGAKSRVQRAKIKLKDLLMNCCHYQFDKYGTVIGIYPPGCCCCAESGHSYQES